MTPDHTIPLPSPSGILKPIFRFRWVSACLVISIVLLLSFQVSSNRNAEGNADYVLGSKIKQMVQSVQFDAARNLARTHLGGDVQKLNDWMGFIEGKEKRHAHLQDGNTRFKQGVSFCKRRDLAGAVHEFEEALKSYKFSGDAKSIAVTTLNLALCHRILQNNEISMAYFDEALIIAKENGMKKYEAKALQGIGFLYNRSGLYRKALPYLEEALALHEDVADKKAEALDWLILGVIEYNRGSPNAENCFLRAMTLAKKIGDVRIQARAGRFLKNLVNQNSGHTPLFSSPSPLETS